MKFKLLLILFTVSCFGNQLFAQTLKNSPLDGWNTEVRGYYGFIMRHHYNMGTYTNHHFPSFEASFYKQSTGKKYWQQLYRYPSYGVAYFYSTLGNTHEIGNVHALCPFIRFPLYRSNNLQLDFRLGFGAGYFTKKFDRTKNYKNLAIGSNVNACISFMYDMSYAINPHWKSSLGISWTHFSNGTMISPNYGINLPMVSAGMIYRVKSTKFIRRDNQAFDKKWSLNMEAGAGTKQIEENFGYSYPVLLFSVKELYHTSQKHAFGIGQDIGYDGSDKKLLQQEGKNNTSGSNYLSYGVSALHRWEIGKLKIDFSVGTYLYRTEKSDASIYDRVTVKYQFYKNIDAFIFLKSHYAKADFMGWGIGWSL